MLPQIIESINAQPSHTQKLEKMKLSISRIGVAQFILRLHRCRRQKNRQSRRSMKNNSMTAR
jgi:hypothetical protein